MEKSNFDQRANMTPDELNELFEKETAHLRTDSFRKKLRETTPATYRPYINMKRRAIIDGVVSASIAILFCWIQRLSGPWWITFLVCVYTIAFVTLEVRAFYRYWHVDPGATEKEMMEKYARQFTGIINSMKIIDSLFIVVVALLLATNVMYTYMSMPSLGLLVILKFVTSLSLRPWAWRGEPYLMKNRLKI